MSILSALAFLFLTGLILSPDSATSGVIRGLTLCTEIIIPTLFPFFVCTKIIFDSGFAKHVGIRLSPIMRSIFNVPGCGGVAFILGSLGGYPLGAKCAVDMKKDGLCTRAEAERIVCFCNNSGPLFVIGAVGAGMFCSRDVGFILYLIHFLSAITIGFLMRFYKKYEKISSADFIPNNPTNTKSSNLFSRAVKDSVISVIYVCGFVVFFCIFLSLAEKFKITSGLISIFNFLNLPSDFSKALCYGFFELTSGTFASSAITSLDLKIIVSSIIIAWSGVCVILQTAGILEDGGISVFVFVIAKFFQGIIAGIYALIFCHIPISTPTFADGFSGGSEFYLHSLLLLGSAVILLLIIALFPIFIKSFIKIK